MAISRIVSQDTTATGTTTAIATYPSPTQAGNLLIAAATCDTTNPPSGSPGWQTAKSVANTGSTIVFWKIATGTETSFTANRAVAATMLLSIHEYSGFIRNAIIDAAVSSTSTAVTIPTGTTPSTFTANELLFAACGILTNNTLTSWSNSFVTVVTISNFVSQFTAQNIVTSTGAYTTTATTTATSAVNQGILVTFRSLPQQLNNYQQFKVGDGMSTSEKIR